MRAKKHDSYNSLNALTFRDGDSSVWEMHLEGGKVLALNGLIEVFVVVPLDGIRSSKTSTNIFCFLSASSF